jgi:hypothetical protein
MLALASATDAASFMLSSASQTWKASESNNVAPIPVPAMPDRSCFLIPEATSVNAWIDAGECFGPSAASTIRMLLLRCVGNEGQSVRARGTWVPPKRTCSGIEGRRAHAEERPAADWCRRAIGTPLELVKLPRGCARRDGVEPPSAGGPPGHSGSIVDFEFLNQTINQKSRAIDF